MVFQIIHLKRFQFVNGRWVKSQRDVTFPLEGLEPLRYTVQNGNGSSGAATPTVERSSSLVNEMDTSRGGEVGSVPCRQDSPGDQREGEAQQEEGAVVNGVQDEEGEEEAGKEDDDGEGKEEEPRSATAKSAVEELAVQAPNLYNLFAICVSRRDEEGGGGGPGPSQVVYKRMVTWREAKVW